MKKKFLIIAMAALTLSLTGCQAPGVQIAKKVISAAQEKTDKNKDKSDKKDKDKEDKKDKSDKEDKTPDSSESNGEVETLLRAKLYDELIPKYGVMKASQTGSIHSPDENWMEVDGILASTIYDFDDDGTSELLVVRFDPFAGSYNAGGKSIVLEMYEAEDGDVKLYSDILMRDNMDAEYPIVIAPNCWNEESFNISGVNVDGECYIFCEVQSIAAAFADGQAQNYWGLSYNNDHFDYAFAFVQTNGGSSDFEYTGFKYKNGSEVSRQLMYSEFMSQKASYEYFDDAITAFFEKYNLKLKKPTNGIAHSRLWQTHDSILSDENDKFDILYFRVDQLKSNYSTQTYDYICRYTSGGEDLEAYRGPAPDMSPVNESYVDYIISEAPDPVVPDNPAISGKPSDNLPNNYLPADAEFIQSMIFTASESYMSERDLYGLSKDELRLLRNGIYAYDGRMFKDETLTAYFSQYSWYSPYIAPDAFKEKMLNPYQLENVKLITAYEKKKGY